MSLLPLLLGGCDLVGPGGGGTACAEYAASSVTVNLIDESGAPIADATLSFSVDGGASQSCESFGDGTYVCGWEQAGSIAITAEREGFRSTTETVEVGMTEDGCHVEGQVLDITLVEVVCTAEIVWAVEATLVGASGEELEGAEVSWAWADADMEPVACEADDGKWLCGEDVSGEIEVTGTADGHTTDLQVVTVEMDADGCHPITQSVELVVDWLPD
jgi:hypothetical protein